MKPYVLLTLALFVCIPAFAAFPIRSKQETTVVQLHHEPIAQKTAPVPWGGNQPAKEGTPIFGILSTAFAVFGLAGLILMDSGMYVSDIPDNLVYGTFACFGLAIALGIIGLKRRGKPFAVAGLITGGATIAVIAIIILLLLLLSLIWP
jgi:hypothetical protein